MFLRSRSLALLLGSLLLSTAAQAAVTPAPLFRDHLVLQQKMPVPVWGTAAANEAVTVSFAGQTLQATADAEGKWSVKLAPLTANATPAELTIAGSNTIKVTDVLVGEVWLASGQSNMQWNVRPQEYAAEIAKANYPLIRTFNVPTVGNLQPQTTAGGAWMAASPQTLSRFTSVGWFFAKRLFEELKVPIGLIHSSWGGTQAESWISREALLANPEIKKLAEDQIAAWERRPEDLKKFAVDMPAWQAKYGCEDKSTKGVDEGWGKPTFDASGWKTVSLPLNLAKLGLKGGGVVWLRKELAVPAAEAGRAVMLELGGTTDGLQLFWDGQPLKEGWGAPPQPFHQRNVYVGLGAGQVTAGKHLFAIRICSLTPQGGLWRTAAGMRLPGGKAAGADQWQYEIETRFPELTAEARKSLPQAPTAQIHNTASGLYNAMVNPLIPFALRGCIWYQGESNTGRARQYRTVLTTLIEDWRKRWGLGNDFAFHIVQLANLGRPPKQPEQNAWAELREAQDQVARTLPNCGLAVTIDIGEADDVHPKNKHDVGARLALWALAKTYGQDVEYSGPQYESMTVEKGVAKLKFSHCKGGLVVKGQPLSGFAVAGRDGVFHWAKAEVAVDSVLVSCPEVAEPVAVRYAWAGNPEGCNLYNQSGLPASPFRTDAPK